MASICLLSIAAAMLAGCGSGSSPSASSPEAAPNSPAPSAAPLATPNASGTVTAGTTVSATGEPSTVGQGVTALDGQSAAWFKTFCGSFAGVADLQKNVQADNPAQAGHVLQQFGEQIKAAGGQMGQQPPPTFQGGAELSANAQQAFTQLGSSFSDFGAKLAAVDPNDQAAAQQLANEFEAQLGQLEQLENIQPDPAVLDAAVQQVPECAALKQRTSAAASSTAG